MRNNNKDYNKNEIKKKYLKKYNLLKNFFLIYIKLKMFLNKFFLTFNNINI